MIRLVNLVWGLIFLLASLGFGLSALGALESYAREPEDVWLLAGWAVLMAAFSPLCFMNRRYARLKTGRRGAIPNVVATLLIFAGLSLDEDPAMQLLAAVSIVPFIVTLIGLAIDRSPPMSRTVR